MPSFWCALRRPQKISLVVAVSCLLLASAELRAGEAEPRFVCENKENGGRSVLGGTANYNVIAVALEHCTGDVDDAAIELIKKYGVRPLGSGQIVRLP
jgi:hypothetical protein